MRAVIQFFMSLIILVLAIVLTFMLMGIPLPSLGYVVLMALVLSVINLGLVLAAGLVLTLLLSLFGSK